MQVKRRFASPIVSEPSAFIANASVLVALRDSVADSPRGQNAVSTTLLHLALREPESHVDATGLAQATSIHVLIHHLNRARDRLSSQVLRQPHLENFYPDR
jgi:hypothetical protein